MKLFLLCIATSMLTIVANATEPIDSFKGILWGTAYEQVLDKVKDMQWPKVLDGQLLMQTQRSGFVRLFEHTGYVDYYFIENEFVGAEYRPTYDGEYAADFGKFTRIAIEKYTLKYGPPSVCTVDNAAVAYDSLVDAVNSTTKSSGGTNKYTIVWRDGDRNELELVFHQSFGLTIEYRSARLVEYRAKIEDY